MTVSHLLRFPKKVLIPNAVMRTIPFKKAILKTNGKLLYISKVAHIEAICFKSSEWHHKGLGGPRSYVPIQEYCKFILCWLVHYIVLHVANLIQQF